MFRFNNFLNGGSTLVIAEFANAFEGNKDVAIEMIDKASEAGVDAFKFQIFFADELAVPDYPKYDLFRKLECTEEAWQEIFDHAYKKNKLIFVDVFGERSFEFSQQFKIDAYKISSTDMTNASLIDVVSKYGVSVILSAGACTLDEIGHAIDICVSNGLKDYVIMHGFQSYPTEMKDANLNVIHTLKQQFQCLVGYADHVDGAEEMALILPLLAIGRGAGLIEKHFTLDRDQKGIDYQSSVNPDVLARLVGYIRDAEIAFGCMEKVLSDAEINYKKDVRKRIIVRRHMEKGEIITVSDLTFKRAPDGIFAEELPRILGKKLRRAVSANKAIITDDME